MADKQISDLTSASSMTDGSLFVIEQGGEAKSANWGIMKNYISPGVAPQYSSSATYNVGDYVIYNGQLYRCTTAISTPESWTAAHWKAAVLGDDVGDLKKQINTIEAYNDYANDVLGLVVPYNLFDKNHAEEGYTDGWKDKYVIDATTGIPRSTTSNVATSYMFRVYNKKKIVLKFGSGQIVQTILRAACYDSDMNLCGISGTGVSEYVLPMSAYYCRISLSYGTAPQMLTNRITICDDGTVGTTYRAFFIPYSSAIWNKDFIQIFPKFTTIGDSLMGGFMNRDGVSVTTAVAKAAGNNWVNYLGLRIGRTMTNLAVGGSTAKQWREELLTDANIDTNAYLIGVGVNDKRNTLSIGTMSDIAEDFSDNADSFYGNYDYILRQLMSWKPTAHIFCFTIPAIEGTTAADYNTAIRAICALYQDKVHCIDLAVNYAIEFEDPIVTENYSGGHFNPVAYNYFSEIIEKAINTFIRNNYDKFATAPYA